MVKTLPSSARGAGSFPGQGTKIPLPFSSQKTKTENRNNIITNSVVFKNGPHPKKKKKSLKKKKVYLLTKAAFKNRNAPSSKQKSVSFCLLHFVWHFTTALSTSQ